MLTAGGAMGVTMPAVLPLRCSIRAFCFCFTEIMERTCSRAAGSSRMMVKPMTTGEMPESTEGRLTSVLMVWDIPLIVTRRFFEGFGPMGEAAEGVMLEVSRMTGGWEGGNCS